MMIPDDWVTYLAELENQYWLKLLFDVGPRTERESETGDRSQETEA